MIGYQEEKQLVVFVMDPIYIHLFILEPAFLALANFFRPISSYHLRNSYYKHDELPRGKCWDSQFHVSKIIFKKLCNVRVVSLTKMKAEKDNNNFMINSTWKHVINFLLIKKNYDLFLYYLILTILNSLSHNFGNGLKDKSFKNELRN